MSVFEAGSSERSPWIGVVGIVVSGIVLGIAYNAIAIHNGSRTRLAWIGEDRAAELEAAPVVTSPTNAAPSAPAGDEYSTNVTDPLAVPGDSGSDLPEIPAAGRPVQIELGALARYVDAGAAFVVDAREAEEYAAGHIPGAVNLPYDLAVSDPAMLESLDTAGRPVITYCGGGTCEQSLSLAYELIAAGHERVAVYTGGWPEWVAAGHRVATGSAE
jgi:rhodanese-related sulfurtransferase